MCCREGRQMHSGWVIRMPSLDSTGIRQASLHLQQARPPEDGASQSLYSSFILLELSADYAGEDSISQLLKDQMMKIGVKVAKCLSFVSG